MTTSNFDRETLDRLGLTFDPALLLPSTLELREFALAGKASFTVLNTNTGRRHSFRVTVAKEKDSNKANHESGPWWVELDGERAGRFCFVKESEGQPVSRNEEGAFLVWRPNRNTFKSRNNYSRGSGYGFAYQGHEHKTLLWLAARLRKLDRLPEGVYAWHSGDCGRCGAELTSDYRLLGYGPTCCKHLGLSLRESTRQESEKEWCDFVRELTYNVGKGNLPNLQQRVRLRFLPSDFQVAREYRVRLTQALARR